MSAAKGNGAGTYLFDWGTDATTAAKSIELTVPGSTTKYAEKYATKLTWTLTDAPEIKRVLKRRIAGNMVTCYSLHIEKE